MLVHHRTTPSPTLPHKGGGSRPRSRRRAEIMALPLIPAGAFGNDPKAERGRGEKSPRWSAERRARHARFARRAPRLTHAAHSRLHRRDNDNKMRPSALHPPFGSGWRSKVANPGRKNAPREREDLGCLKSE